MAQPHHDDDNNKVNFAKKGNTPRTYPAGSFADSMELGQAILNIAAGGRVRRLTLLEKLGRSATSGPTRQLITNSAKYGITKGSYNAEWLELTDFGKTAVDETQLEHERLQARFFLAIDFIPPFKKLYEQYVGKRLPAVEIMRDFLQEIGEPITDHKECIDLFIVNAKFLGLLREIGGAETLVSIEQAIDELPTRPVRLAGQPQPVRKAESAPSVEAVSGDWDKICFYITPIGDDGSEQRKHADLFFGSLVEPAMAEIGLKLVRADKIGQPGMITSQVIEHVKRCRLVIADLSYLNPNVFYEMALRHACKLPVVHIIRKPDRIPFDVNQSRAIVIDDTDIYSLIPKLQSYKAEIATQARAALEDPEHCGNPITVFFPAYWE